MRNFVNNTFVFSLIWLKNKRNGPSPKANWSKKYKSKALRGSNLWAQLKPKCFTLLKILPWIKIIDWLKIHHKPIHTPTNKQQTTCIFLSSLEVFFSLFSALFLFCKFDLLPAGRRIKHLIKKHQDMFSLVGIFLHLCLITFAHSGASLILSPLS